MVNRCAVLGSPIAHSMSPVLHRAAYGELGLDWEYDARETRADELPAFVAGLDGSWRGLSLTMPLKRVVVPLLDAVSDRAAQARAVNTVVVGPDGTLTGHNTDIPGVSAALRERYDGAVPSALVLGGGATAASALLALADLGCPRVTLAVRDAGRAAETLAAVRRHPDPPEVAVRALGDGLPPADLLVSTIPAAAQTPGVVALADTVPVVLDVVYDPWPTPLVSAAERAGAVLVSGLDLLVHQAALQVELMTGRRPTLATLRSALDPDSSGELRPFRAE